MESKTEKCKWCGKTYTVYQNPVWKKAGFGWNYEGHKGYCGNKCMEEANGGGSSSSRGISNSKNSAELARIEWEKEQAEKQEKADKKAKWEAKAKVLREQGKPFMAFVTVNQETIGYISLFVWVMIVPFLLLAKTGLVVKILTGVVFGGSYGFGIFRYLKEMFKK